MGTTSYDRLDSLETNHADWHWKVKLLQVILQSLGSYSTSAVGQTENCHNLFMQINL